MKASLLRLSMILCILTDIVVAAHRALYSLLYSRVMPLIGNIQILIYYSSLYFQISTVVLHRDIVRYAMSIGVSKEPVNSNPLAELPRF